MRRRLSGRSEGCVTCESQADRAQSVYISKHDRIKSGKLPMVEGMVTGLDVAGGEKPSSASLKGIHVLRYRRASECRYPEDERGDGHYAILAGGCGIVPGVVAGHARLSAGGVAMAHRGPS